MRAGAREFDQLDVCVDYKVFPFKLWWGGKNGTVEEKKTRTNWNVRFEWKMAILCSHRGFSSFHSICVVFETFNFDWVHAIQPELTHFQRPIIMHSWKTKITKFFIQYCTESYCLASSTMFVDNFNDSLRIQKEIKTPLPKQSSHFNEETCW